ncbi:hypothetical protein CVT24_002688 [Panaeolus cyanescens]|uniref:Alpha-type protein kinase domain-containing protein n=1 Tax=Panaeolus cyanescens TaxID=181874 RepID=A0A409YYA7_9AGAR|nr:hypothetical protein CVT24_002688 [Panaeolus cyanescens]
MSKSTDTILDELLLKAEKAYSEIPHIHEQYNRPDFTRTMAFYSLEVKGYPRLEDKHIYAGKNRQILLRLVLYEPDNEVVDESDDNIADTSQAATGLKRKRGKSMASASGRRVSARKGPSSLDSIARRTPTSSSSRPLRPSPLSNIGTQPAQPVSVSRSSNKKSLYRSAFQPREIVIQYESFNFVLRHFSTSPNGSVIEETPILPHTIDIARDWQLYKGLKTPVGGYISSGLSKHAFRGRYQDRDVAVFTNKANSTAAENLEDLVAEARVIALAQYFLDSFYQRAKAEGVNIKDNIRWNLALVGTVDPVDDHLRDPSWSADTRPLIFPHFLVAPFLSDFSRERRFCGNDCTTDNQDVLGRTIDAYIHHTLVDSEGEFLLADVQGVVLEDGSVCLYDPQGHSSNIRAEDRLGYFDKGPEQLKLFYSQHKCNSVCRSLGLHYKDQKIGPPVAHLAPSPPPSTTSGPLSLSSLLSSPTSVPPSIQQPGVTSHPLRHGFQD